MFMSIKKQQNKYNRITGKINVPHNMVFQKFADNAIYGQSLINALSFIWLFQTKIIAWKIDNMQNNI